MSSTAKVTASDDRQLDLLFRALGDRTRRALLARLAGNPASVTELAEPFAISLPAISRHIRVLERANLVARKVDGRVHHCSLDASALQTVDGWLRHYRRFWAANLDALARYAEGGPGRRRRRAPRGDRR
jgi:DNA-binding transcriptional ArsR family regulator